MNPGPRFRTAKAGARRNVHGCVPVDERCEWHNKPLVNPKGCERGDPMGGFRVSVPRPFTVDVEIAGADLTELMANLPLRVADTLRAKKSNDGEGSYYRLQLVFNRRGQIERATLLPFSVAYRKRVAT